MKFSKQKRRHWLILGFELGSVFLMSLVFVVLKERGPLVPFTMDEPPVIIATGTVHDGDTLSAILSRQGLNLPLVSAVQLSFAKIYNLRSLQSGHTFEVITSTDGAFKQFLYHPGPIETYRVLLSSGGFFSSLVEKKKTSWKTAYVEGEVTENMYRDLLKRGYDEPFVAWVVFYVADNIFAWQVDFFTEQRPGDKFKILIQQEYLEGSKTPLRNGQGRVLAAYYNGKATRKKENYAVRFLLPDSKNPDYFDLEGQAVRKAFLRAPFTNSNFRISSRFSYKRFHPILRVYRPHHGTDYAAPIGTRVSSIGKGHVSLAGWKGGYGNCVEVRHNATYVSRYWHLSKIAVRKGQSISQGQHVGNVGNSGLSTGPHLHFEMLVNGSSRNFLTMDFPSAASVPKASMGSFAPERDRLLSMLNNGGKIPPPVQKQVGQNKAPSK